MEPSTTLYKPLQDPVLVRGLAHPLRAKILYLLQEHEASPKQLAQHFNVPLPNIAYHIQVLRKLKLIRLVSTTPRRGAVEHHYKADRAAHIDDDAWSQTPGLIKERMVGALLSEIGSYTTQAAAMGGFERENAHLTRTRLELDAEAWDTLAEKLHEVLDLVDTLHAQSKRRLRASNHKDERNAGLVMMLFEARPQVPQADAATTSPGPAAARVAAT